MKNRRCKNAPKLPLVTSHSEDDWFSVGGQVAIWLFVFANLKRRIFWFVVCLELIFSQAQARLAETERDCKIFQTGALVERQLYRSDAPHVFSSLKIKFLYGYIEKPDVYFPRQRKMHYAELFAFDIYSGQPIDQKTTQLPKLTQQNRALLLVMANSWTPIWSRVTGWQKWRDEVETKQFPIQPNIPLHNPVKHRLMNERIGEFVKIQDTLGSIHPDDDVYLAFNTRNEIDKILRCDSPNLAPLPQCNLYQRSEHFTYDVGFDRQKIGSLVQIENQARRFVDCLTQGE